MKIAFGIILWILMMPICSYGSIFPQENECYELECHTETLKKEIKIEWYEVSKTDYSFLIEYYLIDDVRGCYDMPSWDTLFDKNGERLNKCGRSGSNKFIRFTTLVDYIEQCWIKHTMWLTIEYEIITCELVKREENPSVPEPSTMILLGTGILCISSYCRKK